MERLNETEDRRLDEALHALYQTDVPDSFQRNWQNAVKREENHMMNHTKTQGTKNLWTRIVLPVAAVLVLILGANWVGENGNGFNVSAPTATNRSAKTSSKSASSASNSVEWSSFDFAANDGALYAMEAASDMSAETSGSTAPAVSENGSSSAAPAASDSRKLIRTASLTLRTASYDNDLASLQALLTGLGGYVEYAYESGDAANDDPRSLNMDVRVPADKLDAFLNGLEGVGRVVSRSESSKDMTVQYADNEARLTTLRQKMTRLNALLGQASDVADIIEIETAIADTQYQIDSYETTQRTIDRQVDMSQVSITLNEDSAVAVTSEMNLGERISRAFQTSVEGLGVFLRNMLVFIVMALPVIVPVAALIVLWIIVRKNRAKKRAAAQPEEKKESL